MQKSYCENECVKVGIYIFEIVKDCLSGYSPNK